MDWLLADARRAHIHREIDDHELPVGHETRRTGRPYTLVLTKATDGAVTNGISTGCGRAVRAESTTSSPVT